MEVSKGNRFTFKFDLGADKNYTFSVIAETQEIALEYLRKDLLEVVAQIDAV